MFKVYQTQKQKEKYYKNHDKLQNKEKSYQIFHIKWYHDILFEFSNIQMTVQPYIPMCTEMTSWKIY
jgi:hypothetical protein